MSLKASPYPFCDVERNYNLAHEIKLQAEHSVPSPRGIPKLIQQSEFEAEHSVECPRRGDEQLCANENLKMPPRRGDEQYDRLMNNLSPFLLPKSVQ